MLDFLRMHFFRATYLLNGRRNMLRIYDKFKKSQYLSESELQEIRRKKMKSLISYSYENVRYYRDHFRKIGIHPSDLKFPDDIDKLPVMKKEDIQNMRDLLSSSQLKSMKYIQNNTSGSTGIPLKFYQSSNYLDHSDAGRLLCWYNYPGFEVGTKVATIWGGKTEYNTLRRFVKPRWSRMKGVLNTDAELITQEKMVDYSRRIFEFRPKIIRGFVSSLLKLTDHFDEDYLKTYRPEAIISSAETLTEQNRRTIEEFFGVKVYNSYGCREVSQIAMECGQHQGMHEISENNYIEILDDDFEPVSDGEVGRIVVTNLNNYAMPFIRYDICDIAEWSDVNGCECGRNSRMLESVYGRKNESIYTRDGKIFDAMLIMKLFSETKPYTDIKQFQVIQSDFDSIEILIVPRDRSIPFEGDIMVNDLRKHTDDFRNISFRIVDDVIRTKSGKVNLVISEVGE
ncbi:MAG: phenylacetate--CoA ligase family protein [Thermoplasmatota archaeon]